MKNRTLQLQDGRTLGEWLRDHRTALQLTVGALAQRSGVDGGTISRIENDHNLPTILTIARMSYGLNFTIHDLMKELTGKIPEMSDDSQSSYQEHPQQVLRMMTVTLSPPQQKAEENKGVIFTVQDCANILKLLTFAPQYLRDNTFNVLSEAIFNILPQKHVQSCPSSDVLFSSNILECFLQDNPVYQFKILYPPLEEDDFDRVVTSYRKGCFVIPEDADIYVRNTRRKLLEYKTNSSVEVLLRRLTETGIERTKFNDLVTLYLLIDDIYPQKSGEVFSFCWDSCQFLYRVAWFYEQKNDVSWSYDLENEKASSQFAYTFLDSTQQSLALTFARLYRWYQFVHHYPSWVYALRDIVQEFNKS